MDTNLSTLVCKSCRLKFCSSCGMANGECRNKDRCKYAAHTITRLSVGKEYLMVTRGNRCSRCYLEKYDKGQIRFCSKDCLIYLSAGLANAWWRCSKHNLLGNFGPLSKSSF